MEPCVYLIFSVLIMTIVSPFLSSFFFTFSSFSSITNSAPSTAFPPFPGQFFPAKQRKTAKCESGTTHLCGSTNTKSPTGTVSPSSTRHRTDACCVTLGRHVHVQGGAMGLDKGALCGFDHRTRSVGNDTSVHCIR